VPVKHNGKDHRGQGNHLKEIQAFAQLPIRESTQPHCRHRHAHERPLRHDKGRKQCNDETQVRNRRSPQARRAGQKAQREKQTDRNDQERNQHAYPDRIAVDGRQRRLEHQYVGAQRLLEQRLKAIVSVHSFLRSARSGIPRKMRQVASGSSLNASHRALLRS